MRLLHGSHANRDWATVQSFRRVSWAISRLLLEGKASRSSLSAAYTDRLDKPDPRAIQPEVDLVVLEPVSGARQATDKAGNPGLAFPASSHQFRPIVPNGADGERELVMARWGMPGPPHLAASRSPTSVTSRARIGAAGFRRGTAASCLRAASASTKTRSPARPRH